MHLLLLIFSVSRFLFTIVLHFFKSNKSFIFIAVISSFQLFVIFFFFQVLAGSYFSVAGALVGLLKPGRMTMFGTLLVVWGLVKEGILGKPVNTDPSKAVYVYPTMLIALICAVLSVKYDAKKAVIKSQARSVAKPLQSSSKSKLK